RLDFRLGPLLISPSRRHVEGPAGEANVEPLVMQAFLLLLHARGKVVTRNELFDQCWGGAMVGDDSLNRAISGVRRIAAETAPDLFEIETIPRTGYRLIGEILSFDQALDENSPRQILVSRRLVIAGGAATAGAAGLGVWLLRRDRPDPRVAALLEQGEQALLSGSPSRAQGIEHFRQAVAIEPDNAAAWGWLAVAYRNVAENADPDKAAQAVASCQHAARRALSLDDKEANALAALATVRPFFGDWFPAEKRLQRVLDVAPKNFAAINEFTLLLQAAGYCRDSWAWNERAIAIAPLSPLPHYKKALKYWIFGDISQADLTIDRALQLWPRHPAVWNARLMLFAYTGRAAAALQLLRDEQARPPTLTQKTFDFWQPSLVALDSRSPADVAKARAINLEFAPRSPGFSVWAIMNLSMLGQLDNSFEIASGYLLRRGPLVGRLWTEHGQMPVNDHRWRRTMNLFTPAAAPMRNDPRFSQLCDGIGLTDYWARRNVKPDYQLGII
ncbi:MAG: winged helix-turn-helix domain-containing protein, partial [Sphingomicrobium sp.]